MCSSDLEGLYPQLNTGGGLGDRACVFVAKRKNNFGNKDSSTVLAGSNLCATRLACCRSNNRSVSDVFASRFDVLGIRFVAVFALIGLDTLFHTGGLLGYGALVPPVVKILPDDMFAVSAFSVLLVRIQVYLPAT